VAFGQDRTMGRRGSKEVETWGDVLIKIYYLFAFPSGSFCT